MVLSFRPNTTGVFSSWGKVGALAFIFTGLESYWRYYWRAECLQRQQQPPKGNLDQGFVTFQQLPRIVCEVVDARGQAQSVIFGTPAWLYYVPMSSSPVDSGQILSRGIFRIVVCFVEERRLSKSSQVCSIPSFLTSMCCYQSASNSNLSEYILREFIGSSGMYSGLRFYWFTNDALWECFWFFRANQAK